MTPQEKADAGLYVFCAIIPIVSGLAHLLLRKIEAKR